LDLLSFKQRFSTWNFASGNGFPKIAKLVLHFTNITGEGDMNNRVLTVEGLLQG
jgi:hypothetical protein